MTFEAAGMSAIPLPEGEGEPEPEAAEAPPHWHPPPKELAAEGHGGNGMNDRDWVKIADREPDRLTYVLLWAKGWPVGWLGWRDVTGAYRLVGVSRMVSQSSDDHQPTHWHPLPEVPHE